MANTFRYKKNEPTVYIEGPWSPDKAEWNKVVMQAITWGWKDGRRYCCYVNIPSMSIGFGYEGEEFIFGDERIDLTACKDATEWNAMIKAALAKLSEAREELKAVWDAGPLVFNEETQKYDIREVAP